MRGIWWWHNSKRNCETLGAIRGSFGARPTSRRNNSVYINRELTKVIWAVMIVLGIINYMDVLDESSHCHVPSICAVTTPRRSRPSLSSSACSLGLRWDYFKIQVRSILLLLRMTSMRFIPIPGVLCEPRWRSVRGVFISSVSSTLHGTLVKLVKSIDSRSRV